MFLGWYDPDRRKPARHKVAEAVERYVEKFGGQPEACLTSVAEATELQADAACPAVTVKGINFIPRHTFYVGVEDKGIPIPSRELSIRIPMCPPYEVSPNATSRDLGKDVNGRRIKQAIGWREKAQAKTTYKTCAEYATVTALNTREEFDVSGGGVIPYRVVIGWAKGRKEADPDNAAACLKAAIDGIAGVLGVNDKRMVMTDPVAQRRDDEGDGFTEFTIAKAGA